MTALAEALLAAQRQAIGALSKAYVAGVLDVEGVARGLHDCGCTDVIEHSQLLAALDVLRTYGVAAPAATNGASKPDAANEPASQKQLGYIAKLADEKGTTAPDWQLSKAQAHEVIDSLKAGTYDPDKWTAPF